jgi:alkyl hydroperoxide reductase subunit AhpC
LADKDGTVGRSYGVIAEGKKNASRVLFVIDKNGVIQHIQEGIPDNTKLLEVLQKI